MDNLRLYQHVIEIHLDTVAWIATVRVIRPSLIMQIQSIIADKKLIR